MENKNIIYLVKLLIKQTNNFKNKMNKIKNKTSSRKKYPNQQTKLKIMHKDNNNNNKCKQNKNLNY